MSLLTLPGQGKPEPDRPMRADAPRHGVMHSCKAQYEEPQEPRCGTGKRGEAGTASVLLWRGQGGGVACVQVIQGEALPVLLRPSLC